MFALEKGRQKEKQRLRIQNLTPFRSPCTTPRPCIYINPLATSLSLGLEGVMNVRCGQWQWATYKFKPIHVPVGLDEFVDIPTIHPL